MNSAVISLANFGYAGAQFLQILWISRIYGAEELGVFSVIIGLFAPVISFLSSGQRFVFLTQPEHDKNQSSLHIQLRLVVIALCMLCILLYGSIVGHFSGAISSMIVALGFYRIIDSHIEIMMWGSQQKKQREKFIRYALFRILPIPTACLVAFFLQLDLSGYLWVCVSLIALFNAKPYFRLITDFSFWRPQLSLRAAGLSQTIASIFPIGAAAGIESLAITLPRYFLALRGTLEQVAAYTLLMQFSIVFGIVASAMVQSHLPRYATIAKSGADMPINRTYKSLYKLSLFIAALGLGVNLLPPDILSVGIGDWILGYSKLLMLIPAIAVLWYTGGYVMNVTAVFSGRRWLLFMSMLMLVTVGAGLSYGNSMFNNQLELALATLSAAFTIRLVAGLFLLHYRVNQ